MDEKTTKLCLWCSICTLQITHGTIWQHHQDYHQGKTLMKVGV